MNSMMFRLSDGSSMGYCMDDSTISLADFLARIQSTDLIPSRQPLLHGIAEKFQAIHHQGIQTLSDLRFALKTSRRLESWPMKPGSNSQYLVLLRREVESAFPAPRALLEFDWLPLVEIDQLVQQGVRDTQTLYAAAGIPEDRIRLAALTGLSTVFLETLLQLADLTRVQWVSPITARMLVEAGYASVSRLAKANADELYQALIHVNKGERYFKGKIGLRDVKRLIRSAGYLASG